MEKIIETMKLLCSLSDNSLMSMSRRKLVSHIREIEKEVYCLDFYVNKLEYAENQKNKKAWEEVLEELNNIRNNPIANLNQYFIDGIDVTTEIIKEKLSEVE